MGKVLDRWESIEGEVEEVKLTAEQLREIETDQELHSPFVDNLKATRALPDKTSLFGISRFKSTYGAANGKGGWSVAIKSSRYRNPHKTIRRTFLDHRNGGCEMALLKAITLRDEYLLPGLRGFKTEADCIIRLDDCYHVSAQIEGEYCQEYFYFKDFADEKAAFIAALKYRHWCDIKDQDYSLYRLEDADLLYASVKNQDEKKRTAPKNY